MEFLISLAPLGLILCAGIFVQAAAGFAAGLFIIPSLLWFGYQIPEAQASLLVATIPQNIWGIWSLRDSISVKAVAWPATARVLFLPLGASILVGLESFPEARVRQVVGAVVLTITVAIMVFRPQPRPRLHPIWAFIAFPLSGFFQGLVGMGGPAMVFWVQAHDWNTRRMRGFMFAMYLISITPAMLILYFFFGDRIIQPSLVAATMVPMLVLVTGLGLKFGSWLGRVRLRRVTLGLLLLMGLAGLAAPLLSPS
jgi:uncharacterized membrane protein YfcA